MTSANSARRGLRLLWLSLLGYNVVFTLLQKCVFSRLPLPEGAMLLGCAVLASAVPLACGAADGVERPARPAGRPRAGSLAFLFCLAVTGNLGVTLLTPVLESLWKGLGYTARQGGQGDETLTPLLALYICLVGPVLEELVYRGVLLPRLRPFGAGTAVALSALCFGLMHHDLYQGLAAFWCGLVYGYAALRYSLGWSIGLHIAGNTVAVLLPYLRGMGMPGALATLVLAFGPVPVAVAGGVRRLLRRGGAPAKRQSAPARALWGEPALWVLLASDIVYLAFSSFSRL